MTVWKDLLLPHLFEKSEIRRTVINLKNNNNHSNNDKLGKSKVRKNVHSSRKNCAQRTKKTTRIFVLKFDGLGSLTIPKGIKLKVAKEVQRKVALYQSLLRTVKKQPKSEETEILFARYKGEYNHQKRRLELLGILPDSSRPDLPSKPIQSKNIARLRRASASRKHHQAIRQYMETYGKAEGLTYLEARRRWSAVKSLIGKKQESPEIIKWRNLSP